jgi:ribosomal 50S subunit-associated protein YjgA (DUF615 family)
MDFLKRRMAQLIGKLLRREDLSDEERLNAILMAMDAAKLPRKPGQVEAIKKYWREAVENRRVRRRMS